MTEQEQVIKISDIKNINSNNRLRKKPTNIESLASSIENIGLLHPVVLDENNNLIAGYRTIKAYEHLGRTEISYRRVNVQNALQGEYDENVERADFALEDIAEICKLVLASRVGRRPKKTEEREDNDNDENVGNLPTFPKGPSDIVTGKIVGHSEQDVNKIVKLVDAARENPELQYLVDQIDSRDKKLNVTIKEYLHFKIPNPRSRNVVYMFIVVMSTFWPPGWRDTVVCASLEAHRLFYTLGHQSKTVDI
jgi:ParB family transcriptional regulator, chromosome partitioning protein